MAKKEVKDKAFGDFKSAEEINACAAGLKDEGDTDSLKAMAEENGIEADMVTLYISGDIPALCDDMTAAMGKLAVELKEAAGQNKQLIETVIKPFMDSLLSDPDICRAVMDGKHTMDGIASNIWKEAGKRKINNGAYIPDEEIRDMVEDYYRK